jgi:hypothetical protein
MVKHRLWDNLYCHHVIDSSHLFLSMARLLCILCSSGISHHIVYFLVGLEVAPTN